MYSVSLHYPMPIRSTDLTDAFLASLRVRETITLNEKSQNYVGGAFLQRFFNPFFVFCQPDLS